MLCWVARMVGGSLAGANTQRDTYTHAHIQTRKEGCSSFIHTAWNGRRDCLVLWLHRIRFASHQIRLMGHAAGCCKAHRRTARIRSQTYTHTNSHVSHIHLRIVSTCGLLYTYRRTEDLRGKRRPHCRVAAVGSRTGMLRR